MDFRARLDGIEKNGLLRSVVDRSSPQGRTIRIGGRELVNFSSNDYLGLAGHPALTDAACEALKKYGSGAGASRLLSGGTELHTALEAAVAAFKGSPAAVLMNSGYGANTGVMPALLTEGDAVFSDELNHASIIDGIRLSAAKRHIYRHADTEHLRELINKADAKVRVVITDSVFSMDGDIAPLAEICDICREAGAVLYIDDAHATGVLGGQGRGGLSHSGIKREDWIVETGTFSKALGSFGAFVACSRDAAKWIVNSARSFIFSTALPPPVVAASIAALDIVSSDDSFLRRLWENRERAFAGIKRLGLDTGRSGTPIIPVLTGGVDEAVALSGRLMEMGVYAPAIRPPTVRLPRVRLTVTASHTEEDIERLLHALDKSA